MLKTESAARITSLTPVTESGAALIEALHRTARCNAFDPLIKQGLLPLAGLLLRPAASNNEQADDGLAAEQSA